MLLVLLSAPCLFISRVCSSIVSSRVLFFPVECSPVIRHGNLQGNSPQSNTTLIHIVLIALLLSWLSSLFLFV